MKRPSKPKPAAKTPAAKPARTRQSPPDRPTRVVVDLRCFQDARYATRGIGLHGRSIIAQLREMPDVELTGISDPLLDPPLQDIADGLAHVFPDVTDFSGDVYLNLSPMTHDTAPLITAMRRGMRCLAVVHDFIPMRDLTADHDSEGMQYYHYLARSLLRYHALLANSAATVAEIHDVLPGFEGASFTLQCRSRFAGNTDQPPLSDRLRDLIGDRPFVFVASADDPRKNPEVALRAAAGLKEMGLAVVVGGGFGADSRARLARALPRPFLLAPPIFLPRVTEEELLALYRAAETVVVPSRAEGFSMPVAEAISLGSRVVASRIPAHLGQIIDPELFFDPLSEDELLRAIAHARTLPRDGRLAAHYHVLPYAEEHARLEQEIRAPRPAAAPPRAPELIVVAPGPDKPSGVAVYNRMMMAAAEEQGLPLATIDLEELPPAAFYDWLWRHQTARLLYVMGNNNVFHTSSYVAMQNVPADCILHDSRFFEFLLNRHGPYSIVDLWSRRRADKPITVQTVEHWQAQRRDLKDSFLDTLLARTRVVVVHSLVQAADIPHRYASLKARYIPFAAQMTEEERDYVLLARARRPPGSPEEPVLVMFGETEANKGCNEILFALEMLRLAGHDPRLHFVGKSEGESHAELRETINRFVQEDRVTFHRFVSRQDYLDWLAAADIALQLRYPLFGQVSGPVSDVVTCGVPLVTSESLARGMEVEEFAEVVPDIFSPLHISEAVRRILARGLADEPAPPDPRGFADYLDRLLAVVR